MRTHARDEAVSVGGAGGGGGAGPLLTSKHGSD